VILNNPASTIDNAVVILGNKPLGYLVPTFDQSHAVWLGEPFSARDEKVARAKLASQLDAKEAFVVFTYNRMDRANRVLKRYGMPATAGENCLIFATRYPPPMLLCSAVPATNLHIVRVGRPWTVPLDWTGFSAQEDWGVWTQGAETKMVFKLNQPVTQDLALTIHGKALVTDTHGQRLTVTVNGRLVDRQVLTTASPRPKPVPLAAKILGDRDTVEIVLHMPDAASPLELGLGNDARLLGLGIRWVALHPADRRLDLRSAAEDATD